VEDVAADPNYGLLISVTVKGPIPTIQPRTKLPCFGSNLRRVLTPTIRLQTRGPEGCFASTLEKAERFWTILKSMSMMGLTHSALIAHSEELPRPIHTLSRNSSIVSFCSDVLGLRLLSLESLVAN
jgi:hypothetical protein